MYKPMFNALLFHFVCSLFVNGESTPGVSMSIMPFATEAQNPLSPIIFNIGKEDLAVFSF
jgi:hypothetical protein